MRSEKEVDEMIEQMKSRSKGKYITQGVSFNKTCPRQMHLLKLALMESASFSGLAKEMLALRFEPKVVMGKQGQGMAMGVELIYGEPEKPKVKNIGNFL